MGFNRAPKLLDGVVFHQPAKGDAEEVIVLGGGEPMLLRRDLHDALVPLLDGTRSPQALAAALRGRIEATAVIAAIHALTRAGALIDASRSSVPAGPVAVRLVGGAQDEWLRAAVLHAGLALADTDAPPALTLVATDHYLRDELAAMDGEGRPWLPVRLTGQQGWIGPLFVPGTGACHACLAQRLRWNGRIEQFVAAQTGALPVVRTAASAAPAAALAAMAAAVAHDFLTLGENRLADTLLSYDPGRLTTRRHPVVRRPQCPACGAPQGPPEHAPVLRRHPAVEREAGAQATLTRYAHHVDPVTGLLPALDDRSRTAGLHVAGGGAYSQRTATSLKALREANRHRASGKGVSAAAARASALAETLEWITLGAQDPGLLIHGSYHELQRDARIIPPPALSHFSAAQFATRAATNAQARSAKYHVPEPFDPDAKLGWMRVWSLSRREWVLVPGASVAFFPCRFVGHNSNGSAAGATLEEAILHGALEAIERDAVALWWYNGVARSPVSIDGVDAGLRAAMVDAYTRAGQHFHVLDITSDLGVPTMVAIAVDDAAGAHRRILGFGAHPDPLMAITRALTELNQLNPALADVVARDDRPDEARPALPSALLARADTVPVAPGPRCWPAGDPIDEVEALRALLEAHGLELLVADLTLGDIGLPVAKTIIPGLRSAFPEFGPGRLHDVPLAQGWIDTPVSEAAMQRLGAPM